MALFYGDCKSMTILMRTQFGSHLYGTSTPESDTDYKSVIIPSADEILLQKAVGVRTNNTKTNQNEKNSAEDIDDEMFTIHQFCKMLRAGDMIATELLFVPKEKLIEYHFLWDIILDNKQKLISREVRGFLGYCRKQAAKYGIKGSRVAAMRAAVDFFSKTSPKDRVGDYNQNISGLCELNKDNMEIKEIPQANGTTLKHLVVCNRMIPFTIRCEDAYDIVKRIFDEYGSRSLMAETNQGVDWKAVAHAIRVSQQTIELLETGHITFPRHNPEYLISVKRGEFEYKVIANQLEYNLDYIEQIASKSQLAETVDENFLENIERSFHLYSIRKGE